MMTIEEMFMDLWVMDYELGLAHADYFQGKVQSGELSLAGYKKIVGEDYVAPTQQAVQSGQE
ncbi:hypothetical protein [Lactobacillus crispatus]|uniref:hypothetical protein n=1 Tax=Lactobacillus crispatus TaxID=47770 RepID=UPI0022AC4CD2|nr:hypothetical protein [Lactobacillus crispatus]MCZ3846391.1 hypothetical protein [Lactobacillus crispatus]MCZ3848659.1 hypothetical protein [Lactobacillus crispatus]MCZ3854596.1 hypothetical protein [Lactobacillus crispatus]MCZ3856873.1 hypothetical protein [Lactobacillus crispatus]MCZ3859165.1 hypothetical protein [Lactobacillus crispatus]